jgi:hypothetical protein
MSAFRLVGAAGPHWRLPRRALLAPLCLLLVACARTSTSAPRPTPSPTPSPTATPAPQVRFSADWSKGLSGWQATPGWTVANGALESSEANGLALTIPYQPQPGAYTVEIDLQVLNVPRNGGGYVLQVPAASPLDGYQAGVGGLLVSGPRPFGDHPEILTLINPQDDQVSRPGNYGVADFEPGDNVRSYRIEVDTSIVSIYVDGRLYTSAESVKSSPLATGPLTLQVSGVQVRITAIEVIA